MSGSFSVGGLVSGIDSDTLISQLVALERQPITRLQSQISLFQQRQEAIRGLRTTLTSLRNTVRDFQLTNQFSQFGATSSDSEVLTAEISGQNPVSGAYTLNVTQLASATVARSSARMGSPINTAVPLNSSGLSEDVTTGKFSINGVVFDVNGSTDSLDSILSAINSSSAGVTASYNATTDKVTIANTAAGNTSVINFTYSGDEEDTVSNFLNLIGVSTSTQYTNGSGSTETVGTRNLGAIAPSDLLNTVNFAGGAVTSGSFRINGVSITVDVTVDSVSDVIQRINDSGAGVTASYDGTTDSIQVVSNTLGSRTISFQSGTSNFLDVTNLTTATQTAGQDSKFTINGGALQTRNSNEISDAIGGVTLNLQSTGTSTVTVSTDNDAIVEKVQEFIDNFNTSISEIRGLAGNEGTLSGDSTILSITSYLQQTVFNTVAGLSGKYTSLLDIGISTGDSFDSSSALQLELDSDKFLEALRDGRVSVSNLFSNADKTGIMDQMFSYLDEVTGTSGFLNERARSNGIIDEQIDALNDRIDRMEDRVTQYETRLKKQFSRLEQLSATYQSQNSALSSLL
ncbi:MAG: flagellar filament capping protein FliD [Candidatus Hydrogenedentes bacterium]|nr:flagellar filament capping protein FliD [Candidatus Hydrogenedentota bacterium]